MFFHKDFMCSTQYVFVILEIVIDNFLSKQELTLYLYWRRLFYDTNIAVKKFSLRINKIIICFLLKFCTCFKSCSLQIV